MKRAPIILAGAAVLAAVTACGGAAAAHPASCITQYRAWQHSPARAEATTFVADMSKVQDAANLQDIPQIAAMMKRAGADATALQAYPMPACADPAGYWHQMLASVRAATDNANMGGGSLGALALAEGPGRKAETLIGKLGTELQRTVPAAFK